MLERERVFGCKEETRLVSHKERCDQEFKYAKFCFQKKIIRFSSREIQTKTDYTFLLQMDFQTKMS